jgi:hypothetical protein
MGWTLMAALSLEVTNVADGGVSLQFFEDLSPEDVGHVPLSLPALRSPILRLSALGTEKHRGQVTVTIYF